jgi:DNA helicase-2/ATP-dependent DNA helicase PcrA
MEDEPHKLPGPVLVLAGPGTGKTERLAKRIKWLVEEKNIDRESITVITFTVAAAREMRERISDPAKEDLYIAPDKQPEMIRTIHSLGYRIIRDKAPGPGLNEDIEVVYSDNFQKILLGDAAQLAGFSRKDGEETGQCRRFGNCSQSDERKCKICKQYQTILRRCSAVDYDDQILLACKLLKKDETLLTKYRSYCQQLLVDEYQDINAGQFELIQLLSEGQREGLFVVGDDDQSIYSWRGGSPKYIRNFKKDFGDKARIETLRKSRRCPRYILEGAMAVVNTYDKNRLPKGEFEYIKGDGKKIQVHSVPSDEKEAQIVKQIAKEAMTGSRTVLILLPYRRFAKAIVSELRKARIEYCAPLILPGEGLPIISTLSKWLADNSDSLCFRECLEAFISRADSGIPSDKVRKPDKIQERENALLKVAGLWRHPVQRVTDSFWEALELEKGNDALYSKLYSAFEHLLRHASEEDPSCFLQEVVKTVAPWKKTEAFLEEIDLWVETSKIMASAGRTPSIQLTTLQGAKGLQAHVVCVLGLEEGTLPKSNEGLSEDSRIMFVTMTRASEELHLFYARKRSQATVFRQIYKPGKEPDLEPSRFLVTIPEGHKELKYHPA